MHLTSPSVPSAQNTHIGACRTGSEYLVYAVFTILYSAYKALCNGSPRPIAAPGEGRKRKAGLCPASSCWACKGAPRYGHSADPANIKHPGRNTPSCPRPGSPLQHPDIVSRADNMTVIECRCWASYLCPRIRAKKRFALQPPATMGDESAALPAWREGLASDVLPEPRTKQKRDGTGVRRIVSG